MTTRSASVRSPDSGETYGETFRIDNLVEIQQGKRKGTRKDQKRVCYKIQRRGINRSRIRMFRRKGGR